MFGKNGNIPTPNEYRKIFAKIVLLVRHGVNIYQINKTEDGSLYNLLDFFGGQNVKFLKKVYDEYLNDAYDPLRKHLPDDIIKKHVHKYI